MDLVPHLNAPAEPPSMRAFDRDHVAELVEDLTSRLPQIVGHPVAVTRMGGGVVGIEVPPASLLTTARFLRDTLNFEMLTSVSGVDMVDHLDSVYHLISVSRNWMLTSVSGVDMVDHLDSVYHLISVSRNWILQIRVSLPPDTPEVDSLVSVYDSANWLEREEYDLVGIVYTGHPDLRRIMLDDDFQGHPLLKSFRSTPSVVHDPATTQVDPRRALASEQQRGVERVVAKRLGQGQDERLHPGTPTFGNMAIFSRTGQGVEPPEEDNKPATRGNGR